MPRMEAQVPGNHNDIEKRLWGAADGLRAYSKLKASEYSLPVLGLIILKYADFMIDSDKVGYFGVAYEMEIPKYELLCSSMTCVVSLCESSVRSVILWLQSVIGCHHRGAEYAQSD